MCYMYITSQHLGSLEQYFTHLKISYCLEFPLFPNKETSTCPVTFLPDSVTAALYLQPANGENICEMSDYTEDIPKTG